MASHATSRSAGRRVAQHRNACDAILPADTLPRDMERLANPKKLTHDQLIERWTDWLKQTEKSSFHLYRSRYTWENIQRLFKANPPLQTDASHILEWMHHNFWNEHAIAIRKEMEHGQGYLTLMNFLDELERFSEIVLTRKRWRTLYSRQFFHEYGIPDKDFDRLPGAMCRYPKQSPDTDCISKDSVHRARITLKNVNAKVVNFAHAFVAHRTNVEKHDMSLADIYEAVNRIFDTYATYYRLVLNKTWMGRYPTPQFDWFKGFTPE
jgi:hypothetical protein